jgi:hypothetical protein
VTDANGRQMIELPVGPDGETHIYYLGSMTIPQAATFSSIPGPGEWYAAHRDESIKDGEPGPFTLLLGDAEGQLTAVTVEADGRRSR